MADEGKQEEVGGSETQNITEKMDATGEEESEDDIYEVEKIVGMSAKDVSRFKVNKK